MATMSTHDYFHHTKLLGDVNQQLAEAHQKIGEMHGVPVSIIHNL